MGKIKSTRNPLGIKIIKRLEGIRLEQKMEVKEFVKCFDMTPCAWYQLRAWANGGVGTEKYISIKKIEYGLEILKYDAHIIFTDREEK